MKKAFLKRFLSSAVAAAVTLSAMGSLLTSAASSATEQSSTDGIYQILKTDGVGWNTAGITHSYGITDESGRSLNKIVANYAVEGMRAYFKVKTPEEAGYSLSEVKSIAYYVKNGDSELPLTLEHLSDRKDSNGNYIGYGRLTGGSFYLVGLNNSSVKPAMFSNKQRGTVSIPAGFEGYVVIDAENATDKTLVTDSVKNLSGSLQLYSPSLKAAQEFYYGEITANTVSALDFISTVKSNAVYQYPVTTGHSWGFENNEVLSIDESDPYNKIFTGIMPSGRNQWNFDQIGFNTVGIKAEYGRPAEDITAVSFYVNNRGGHGEVKLRLGNKATWTFFANTYWDYYDINTGKIVNSFGQTIVVPEGFEGYVILNVRQTAEGDPNSKYAEIFNGDTLWFHEGQDKAVAGLEISIGAINVWCGDYANVKKTLAAQQNSLTLGLGWDNTIGANAGFKSNEKFNVEKAEGVAFDGNAIIRKYTNLACSDKSGIASVSIDGSVARGNISLADFLEEYSAFVTYFKNPLSNDIRLGVFNEKNNPSAFNTIKVSWRLFDTAKQTLSEEAFDKLVIPAGFEGYVIINIDNTMVKTDAADKPFRKFIAEDRELGGYVYNVNFNDVGIGNSFYYGTTRLVKDVDRFIGEKLNVTVAGDANKDGSTDLLDLVRLKKYNAGIGSATVYVPNISYNGVNDTNATALAGLKAQLLGGEVKVFVSDEVKKAVKYTAEPEPEVDTVPAAANEVGFALYHMAPGDWDALYGTSIAEEQTFINNYSASSLDRARLTKARGGTGWIYISRGYLNSSDSHSSLREGLLKYVETLKAEKLWNTIAGFEFEEISGESDEEQASFTELSQWLNEQFPQKRQFAVLSVAEVNAAKPQTYSYITDIAFDYYTPDSADELREVFNTMVTNTGLKNARYWFMPGVYTKTIGDAAATHALNQLNACYQLLMEQKLNQRGGLYVYNWLTFGSDSKAYGLDELLAAECYAPVKEKLLELAANLNYKPDFVNITKGEIHHSGSEHIYDIDSDVLKNVSNPKTFSYYIKNNTSSEQNAFMWFNNKWYTLKGTVYTYDINSGVVKTIENAQQWKMPGGFEGYVLYDLEACTYADGNAQFTAAWKAFNTSNGNDTVVFNSLVVTTDSAEMVDSYYRSLIRNTVINDGTDGSKASIWTPIKGTSSHGYSWQTVNGVSPDGTAIKLEYTTEELEKRSHNGATASENTIGLTYSPDNETVSRAQALSYYVNLSEGEQVNIAFSGLAKYKSISNAVIWTYDLKTHELKKHADSVKVTDFEGYIIFDLRNALVSGKSWVEYTSQNGISRFQFDLVAKSFVNRPLVIDSITLSSDFCAMLGEITAK